MSILTCYIHIFRQYHWANYSTGLGASLHELGHTFDLAHTPTGIMSRGFDDIYRTFLAQHMAVSRESSSRESSRLASPIPYSPKESPVHRPRRKESIQASWRCLNLCEEKALSNRQGCLTSCFRLEFSGSEIWQRQSIQFPEAMSVVSAATSPFRSLHDAICDTDWNSIQTSCHGEHADINCKDLVLIIECTRPHVAQAALRNTRTVS